MKKLLVLQHVPHEGLGTLDALLQNAGVGVDTIHFWREPEAEPGLNGYDGLVILGGPMGVYDAKKIPHLTVATKLIESAVKNNLPVLGICLGSQLIAGALGARVYPSGIKEIGWYDLSPAASAQVDPLFRHLNRVEKVFQWHGDTFDLPNGAVHLATSPFCTHQAFRYGGNVYALQFHLEVDEAMIDAWLNVPENQKEIAGLGGKIDPEKIRRATPTHIGRLRQLSEKVFGEFIRLFG